jgi:hypothetical protein
MDNLLRVFNTAAFIFDVIDATQQSSRMLAAVLVFSVVIDIVGKKLPFRHTAEDKRIVEDADND